MENAKVVPTVSFGFLVKKLVDLISQFNVLLVINLSTIPRQKFVNFALLAQFITKLINYASTVLLDLI